jgi:hypothetical protein
MCNNSNKTDNTNAECFVLLDSKIKEEITVSIEKVNIKLYLGDEYVSSVIIKTDSLGMDSYKKMILGLYQHKTTEVTKVYCLVNESKIYIADNEITKNLISDFDKSIKLSENIVIALKTKANIEIESDNFSKAIKLAELFIYSSRPFYFGAFKDDRPLKIIQQKALYESGRKKEAIINLLEIE